MKKMWAMAAAILIVASTGEAFAACSKGKRISHRDATCLEASWDNRCYRGQASCYRVRNLCAKHGTVVAKIDVVGASDHTLHLTDGKERSGTIGGYNDGIHWISCCKDISDLCYKPSN